MLGRAVVLALFTAFAIATPTLAHDTIPADWCPVGSSPVILSEFTLSPEHLRHYRHANEKTLYDGCLEQKTCGIIDEWFWANEAAGAHCASLGLRASTPEDAIPFVNAPKSFGAVDHHALYDFDDGTLRGQCVVCRTGRPPVSAMPSAD